MKEIYEKEILEKVKKSLKLEDGDAIILTPVGCGGDKITFDGVEYFEPITKVDLNYQGSLVGTYDLAKDVLSTPRYANIVIARKQVKIVKNS